MSVPSWARVGAKVVCISVHPAWAGAREITPEVGRHYTLRHLRIDPADGMLVCWLAEIPDQLLIEDGNLVNVAFGLFRFRPLVTRTQEQDVRAIKSMLRELPAETRLDRLLEALDD